MPLLWLSIVFITGVCLGAGLGGAPRIWLAFAGAGLTWLFLRRVLAPRFRGMVLRRRHGWLQARRNPAVRRLLAGWLHIQRRVRAAGRKAGWVPLAAVLVAAALGGARYRAALPDWTAPDFLPHYNDPERTYIVEGLLVKPPEESDFSARLRVRVERLRPRDGLIFVPVHGDLLVQAPPGGDWRYGDRLRLQGVLADPPENEVFSYRRYLARQGIFSQMRTGEVLVLDRDQGSPLLSAIYTLRARGLGVIRRLYPEPEASLLAGIVLGIEGGIPARVEEAFRATGTSHIIAISGFNITILGGVFITFFLRLLGKPRRFLAAGLSTSAITAYTVLVGADAAVVRAAIMGALALFGRQFGRRQDGLNSLGLVAAMMALLDPFVLWDVGFQLSFAATLGLVLYAEPMTQAFTARAARWLPLPAAQRLAGPVSEYILLTFAAQLTTLPVMIFHFRRVSLVSLVANPVILPVQPAVMIFGGLTVIAGLLISPLGSAAALMAWPFLAFTIRAVELFARLPGGEIFLGEVAWVVPLAWYVLLLGWTFWRASLRAWLARRGGASAPGPVGRLVNPLLVGLALVNFIVWQLALTAPDGRLRLTLLDVGGGEALLVQTPGGRSLLVNGGASPSALADALGRRLPLARRRIDVLIVANPDEEHIAALPNLVARYVPDQVLWAGPTHGSWSARRLQEAFNTAGRVPQRLQTGEVYDLGEGVRLQVPAVSARGAVLLLEWGHFRALLPLGVDYDTLEALRSDPELGPVTVLLLAESGYAPANPPEWIAQLQPELVLLSAAVDDPANQPDPETLQTVENYTLLRTDLNGWIELSTDGEELWVEIERVDTAR